MKTKLVSPLVEFSNVAEQTIYGVFSQRPLKTFYLRQLRQQEQLDVLAELSSYLTPLGTTTFSKISDATIKISNIRLMQAIYDLAWNYSVEFNQAPQFTQWAGGPNDAQKAASAERTQEFESVYGVGCVGANQNMNMFWQGVKMFDNTRRDTASLRSEQRALYGAAGEVSRGRSNPASSAESKEAVQLKSLYQRLRLKEQKLRELETEVRTLRAKTSVAHLREATRRKKLAKLDGHETARLNDLLHKKKPALLNEIEQLAQQIGVIEDTLDTAFQTQIGNANGLSVSKMYMLIGHTSRTDEGKATSYRYYRPEQTFVKYILYGLLDFIIGEIRSQTVGFEDVYVLPTVKLLTEYLATQRTQDYTFQVKATGYRAYSEAPPTNPTLSGVFLKDTPLIHFEGGLKNDLVRLFFDRQGFLIAAFENTIQEAAVARSFVDNKFIALPIKIDARQTEMLPQLPRERHSKVKYTTYDFYNIFSRVFKGYSTEDIKAYTLDPMVKLIVPAVYQTSQIWEELCDFVGELTLQAEPSSQAVETDAATNIQLSVHDCPTFLHIMYTLLGVFPNIEITASTDVDDSRSTKRAILYQRLNPARRTRG